MKTRIDQFVRFTLLAAALAATASQQAMAASNGICGPTACVLVSNFYGGSKVLEEVFYTAESEGKAAWQQSGETISKLGGTGWQPVVGDFNADKADDIAVYKDGVFRVVLGGPAGFLTAPELVYTLAEDAGWNSASKPVSGDWDGSGSDDLGLYTEGKFILFPHLSDIAEVIEIDFGFLPDLPGYGFAPVPVTGPIDNNRRGIARAGIFFGDSIQYAPETVSATYDFFDFFTSTAVQGTQPRPDFFAKPTVLNVSLDSGVADNRMVFMMPPDLDPVADSVCTGPDFACVALFPSRPDTQQPVIIPQ